MTPETFWDNVKRGEPAECWPWTRAHNGRGYGRLRFKGKYEAAHRVAFELAAGRRPELHVLHSCDNPKCCNPAHLREGTALDNSRDMVERGRSAVVYSNEIVNLIRELHVGEGWTAERIWFLCEGTPSLRHIRHLLSGRARGASHVLQ